MNELIKWLLIGIIVYYAALKLKQIYLSRKWGCKPPYHIKQLPFGIDIIKDMVQRTHGYHLDNQVKNFYNWNCNTYQSDILLRLSFVTKNPENMKHALADQFNNFSIGARKYTFKDIIGHGIFAAEGDRWKASRDLLRSQFSREQVSHIQSLEPHFLNFANHLKRLNHESFDIQPLIHKLTLDASSEFLFSESMKSLSDDFDQQKLSLFEDSLETISKYFIPRQLLAKYCFLVRTKEFKNAVGTLHEFVQKYVQMALNTSREQLDDKSKGGYIILYELAKVTRDPIVIQDELLSIMFAGRDTTASLLSFLLFELSRNPKIWNKLKLEIYEQFGDGENVQFDKITFESMKKCTYLKWCINEALRMYPPVPINLRVPNRDLALPNGGGDDGNSPIFVPKNSSVVLSVFAAHREESVYGSQPDVYRPERWENLRPGWSFMPFGSGPRVCLGQQFALTEASYITIRMAQTFPNLASCEEEYPPRKVNFATMHFRHGLHVKV